MNDPEINQLTFHFIKSPSYRTIHIDGAFGGLTTKGKISASLFSERAPLPQRVTHELESPYKLGKEIERVTKKGVIRELEATCIIDIPTARSIAKWLTEKADELESLNKETEHESHE